MNESSPSFANELLLSSTSVTDLVSFKSGDTKKAGQNRFIASVARADGSNEPVILEWRYVDRSLNFNDMETIRSRIKTLAVVLSSERSADFGLLRCIGHFKDTKYLAEKSIERYGLLFRPLAMSRLPQPSNAALLTSISSRPYSLHEYINGTTTPPFLGDRFQIATALCNIILQLHASDWLHKAVSSSNVLFSLSPTYSSSSDLDPSHPFLLGFDFSRPDRPTTPSLENPLDRSSNDYRHPSLWLSDTSPTSPRFRKQYNIYALGVVLLEIGNWSLIGAQPDKYRDSRKPQVWQNRLLLCAESLGSRCGKIYQEVVETCLMGRVVEHDSVGQSTRMSEFEAEDFPQASFLFDVVYKLGRCFA